MKIGIDAHGVGGRSLGCGNETYFANLILQLIQKDHGNEYHIFTRHPEFFEERIGARANVRYVSLWPHSQWLQRPLSVPLYVQRHKLDLLHFPFIRPPFTSAKCIVTVHDVCFETHPEYFRKLEVIRMRALIQRSCARAEAVFTVSEFARQQIHQLYDVPLERIVVTHNAADHMRIPETAAGDHGINRPYILYTGLLQPRKNLVRLVKAYEHLVAAHDVPHDLVLSGKWGWGNDELKTVLERSPIRQRIHVPGYVSNARLSSLMAHASAFAFPSIFEGFGIPPMEAQRYGVPVVVSSTSCFPEVYGNSAEYCDPLNVDSISAALAHVLLNQKRRDFLIGAGTRNWQRFSWSETAGLVLQQYESIYRTGLPVAPMLPAIVGGAR